MKSKELKNWTEAVYESQRAGFKAAKDFLDKWKSHKAFYIDRDGKKTEIK